MIPPLPSPLRPFVPTERVVVLAPYTAVTAAVVPNLGLRLLFPRALAGSLHFAITNPYFQAVHLGLSGILITAVRGAHHRYCGNMFLGVGPYAVSLLVCTTRLGDDYTSDVVFTVPPRPPAPPAPPRVRLSPWRRAWAYAAFAPIRRSRIRKERQAHAGRKAVRVWVRRFLVMPKLAILGFALSSAGTGGPLCEGVQLYRGHHKWRRVPGRLACTAPVAGHQNCALAITPPSQPVARWHLLVTTIAGLVRVSW